MALTQRYFGVSGAGSMDGTSFANRAPLYVAGSLNSIITGFNFAADSLLCWIKPGNYTSSQTIMSGIFSTTAPVNSGFGCYFYACDADGNPWQPPNWRSPEIPTWKADLPIIDHTANSAWLNQSGIHCYGLQVVRSNSSFSANTGPFNNFAAVDWCWASVSANSTSAYCFSAGAQVLKNCGGECSGTSYNAIFVITGSTSLRNCKAIGNASASSGSRAGYTFAINSVVEFTACSASGVDIGILNTTSTSGRSLIEACTLKAATTGVQSTGAATTNVNSGISKSFICAGTYGIQRGLVAPRGILNNRLRATTPISAPTEQVQVNNQTAAGSDAAEFVDATNHDLRIKNTSTYWGQGLGAGDQAAAASGTVTGFRNRGIRI